MKTYEECKKIAEEKATAFGTTIDKAFTLGNSYVFDSSEEFLGILPVAVDKTTGAVMGLWQYVNKYDLTMDDMIELDFDGGDVVGKKADRQS